MSFSKWISGIFRGTSDDEEAAEVEEYGGPDPGDSALHKAEPSYLGGITPLTEDEFSDHPHDPNP
ncbi:MAG TPA: hypothetical protein VH063_12520 [Gaiellaceae bacterium]|jgi:hypothetical protein|nr:hypothetical protein [Gaiellaceae bacterium]